MGGGRAWPSLDTGLWPTGVRRGAGRREDGVRRPGRTPRPGRGHSREMGVWRERRSHAGELPEGQRGHDQGQLAVQSD